VVFRQGEAGQLMLEGVSPTNATPVDDIGGAPLVLGVTGDAGFSTEGLV
jgi:hypothetical protein